MHLKRELDMKQRIKLKGRLKAYLQTAIILGIVLAGVNIGIYFLDVHSGIIVSFFLVVYFTAMLILLYHNKPIIMNEFISFATQYGQIQRRLLRDLELPHVLMDETGKIIWTNIAFENVVHKEKGYRKSITTLFPSITREKLQFDQEVQFELEFEQLPLTLLMSFLFRFTFLFHFFPHFGQINSFCLRLKLLARLFF